MKGNIKNECLRRYRILVIHPNSGKSPEFLHFCTYVSMNTNYYFIIIVKKDWQCKAGRGRLTPYQSEDPSPTLPTYREKEEKGKIVEDKQGESN